jgi:hypothetical protein
MHRLTVLTLLCLSLALAACRAPEAGGNELAIYLTLESFTPAQLVLEPGVIDLDTIPLETEPILTQDDIVRYDAETHTFDLTLEAAERLEALQWPLRGPAFVVTVGTDRIYAGAFWTPLSSLSFDGIVILWLPHASSEGYTYRVDLGYPGPDFFTGPDPRSDSRILQALERGGLLEAGQLQPE